MLSCHRKKEKLLVALTGEVDHCSAPALREELDALLCDQKIKLLVLDMRDVTMMDSSGIGLLIGRYREMARRGGGVAVCNMSRQITKIFEMSGLGQIIQSL